MKRIWLVRHAQSKAETGETDDHLNPSLSDLGMRQAARLKDRLKDLLPDLVLVSPLRRAWETYKRSQAPSAHAEFDSRLIELDWGQSGVYQPILPLATPSIAAPDRQDAWLQSDEERVASLLHALLGSESQTLLLFGHWGVFHRLLLEFIGVGPDTGRVRAIMANTGLSLLEVDEAGSRFVRFWNDYAHVSDLISPQP